MTPVWGPYDAAALGWIYSNNLSTGAVGPVAPPAGMTANGISGQVTATAPWNDPLGFNGATERAVPLLLRRAHEVHAALPPARHGDDARGDHGERPPEP